MCTTFSSMPQFHTFFLQSLICPILHPLNQVRVNTFEKNVNKFLFLFSFLFFFSFFASLLPFFGHGKSSSNLSVFERLPTEKKDLGSIPALRKCSFSPWIKDHRDLCKISMYKTAEKKWDLAIKNCLVTFHSDSD